MRVLIGTQVAERPLDGLDAGVLAGELLFFPAHGPRRDACLDGHVFLGLESRRETTVAEVADLSIGIDDIVAYVAEHLGSIGGVGAAGVAPIARDVGEHMAGAADGLPVGAIVQRCGDLLLVVSGRGGAARGRV